MPSLPILPRKAKPEGGFGHPGGLRHEPLAAGHADRSMAAGKSSSMQPTERSKQKTDRRDAGELGHLLWVHRQQFVERQASAGNAAHASRPTPRKADDRQVTALRARLTKKRTAVLNGIHKILRETQPGASLPDQEVPDAEGSPLAGRDGTARRGPLEMNLLLPQWELLDEQLESVEAKIAERAAADEQVQLPGNDAGLGALQCRGDRLADRRHRAVQAARQPGELFRPDARLPQLGRGHAAAGFDHQAGQQDGALPAEPGGGQGPAIRRRDADWFKRIKKRRGRRSRAWR